MARRSMARRNQGKPARLGGQLGCPRRSPRASTETMTNRLLRYENPISGPTEAMRDRRPKPAASFIRSVSAAFCSPRSRRPTVSRLLPTSTVSNSCVRSHGALCKFDSHRRAEMGRATFAKFVVYRLPCQDRESSPAQPTQSSFEEVGAKVPSPTALVLAQPPADSMSGLPRRRRRWDAAAWLQRRPHAPRQYSLGWRALLYPGGFLHVSNSG